MFEILTAMINMILSSNLLRLLSGVVISALCAFMLDFILSRYIHFLASKTKTTLDDELLASARGPLWWFVFLGGIWATTKSVSWFNPIVSFINPFWFVLMTLVVTVFLSRVVRVLIPYWLSFYNISKAPRIITKILSAVVYIISLVIILDHFDVEISPFIATLGIGGLAVGLALQDTLSNFFAGIHLLSDKPVNVGDFIELQEGISGHVDDIGWRSTRIKTLANNFVIIPNAKLSQSIITNTSLEDHKVSFSVECGVSYKSDLDKVERIALEVAKKVQRDVPGAVSDAEPALRFFCFSESNIDFKVGLTVEDSSLLYIVRHEFIKQLKKRFDKERIEISYPVRKIVR